ncbi:hypothetical protein VKT23_007631 [Stygiomarasmius scandens]|uniref:FAD-binding domain-containing protein n=1 Tax=Marasmiellus scandens TaxID=2682957 RepID=A0ABR1JLL3_9AGAR
MVFTGEIMESLQSQYYHIAYSDLWNHFYNLCKQCDVEFKFGFDVVEAQAGKVDLDPVTISSSSGEEVICDIVVGADGNHSTIRKLVEERERLVLGEESDVEGSSESKPSLAPWIRISLPVARMQTDPGLAELSREDWWNIWMFNGVAYNCGKEGPDQYVLNIFCDHPRYANLQETDWSEETTSEVPELLKRVAEPQLQKIIELASSFQVTKQASRVLHRYTDKCNQVVIIGAAAHACMINGTFNSAIAIEDAFTLGYLFSRMSARNEIPYLLHGLGEIRQRHTEIVKASDSDVLHLLCMPPGPEQEARDALFKQTHREDSENEETLEFMWSSYITQFDYDAKEAVEEWWLNWMKPIENSR